jgi:hypothetical protein
MNKILALCYVSLALLFLYSSCDKSTEPKEKETKGNISGKVMYGTTALTSAYLFIGDSLRATTDDSGSYAIMSLQEGNYDLLCSAINFQDDISQVLVIGGNTITCDFFLIPDTSTGYIRGEFQDIILFNDSLLTHPSMANWDAQQIWQSTTGATMISKFLGYDVPRPKLYLDDVQVAPADEWAQFAFKIQCGTYLITGRCEGYFDASEVVKVLPGKLDNANFITFFMMRSASPKIVMKK